MKTNLHILSLKMVKNNLTKLFMLLLMITITTGCSKSDDEPVVYSEENPLPAYIQNSGFDKITSVPNALIYEYGYKFSPKVKGKINAITLKLPDVASNVRVTLWDNATKTILKTYIIPTTTPNVETKLVVDPYMLEANKEYMLSYNITNWYYHLKTGGGNTTYPIPAGNISILGFQQNTGPTQTYPATAINSYCTGDVSFVFQQVD